MARRRSAAPLALQWAELAFAVPQVVNHRLTRMALAGPAPTTSDRREFARMSREKAEAFTASWQAMSTQTMFAGQAFAVAGWNAWLAMATGRPAALAAPADIGQTVARVMSHGLGPIHRTATRNARRLSTTLLR